VTAYLLQIQSSQPGAGLQFFLNFNLSCRLLTSSMLSLTFIDADLKTFKQHFESMHPKSPMVPVLVDVQT
uniref:Uncharacterized protein n=1 Tax=Salmo trutta TaxID=8032 RepID=A0A674EG44_SALTR